MFNRVAELILLKRTSKNDMAGKGTNVNAPLYSVAMINGRVLLSVNRTKIQWLMKIPNTNDFSNLLNSSKKID